jgi:hypothetical protein
VPFFHVSYVNVLGLAFAVNGNLNTCLKIPDHYKIPVVSEERLRSGKNAAAIERKRHERRLKKNGGLTCSF